MFTVSHNPIALHSAHVALVSEIMSRSWDRMSLSATDGILDSCIEFKAFHPYAAETNPLARELLCSIERMLSQTHTFVRLDCERVADKRRNLFDRLVVSLRPPVAGRAKKFKIDVDLELIDVAGKQSMSIQFDATDLDSSGEAVLDDDFREDFTSGRGIEVVKEFFEMNLPIDGSSPR